MIEDAFGGPEPKEYVNEIWFADAWEGFRTYFGEEGRVEAGRDFEVLAKGFKTQMRCISDGEIVLEYDPMWLKKKK